MGTPTFNGPRPPLELSRVQRSLDLAAVELQSTPGSFVVTSAVSGTVRYVQLRPDFNCDCPDALYRNQICKHLIAALRADGDEEAILKSESASDHPPYAL